MKPPSTTRVFVVAIASLLTYLATGTILIDWTQDWDRQHPLAVALIVTSLPPLCSVTIVYSFLRRRDPPPSSSLIRGILCSASIGFLGGALCYALFAGFVFMLYGTLSRPSEQLGLFALFLGVLLGPFLEELVWRGRLFDAIAEAASPIWAVLATSLMFSLVHLSSGRSADFLFLLAGYGLVYGICKLVTARFISPVLAHCTTNGLILALGSQ